MMWEENAEEIEILKQQLENVKRQDRIYEDIEIKLHQMKEIAQYAAENTLSDGELVEMEKQMQRLRREIGDLKKVL